MKKIIFTVLLQPVEERVKLVHIIGLNDPEKESGLRDSSIDGFDYSIPYTFKDMNKKWLTEEGRISIAKEVLKEHDNNFKVKGIIDVTHHIPKEYIKQAEEILLHTVNEKHLDYLVVPVGTGRTFMAFYTGLINLQHQDVKINTKLLGIVPKGEHPITNNFVFDEIKDGTIERIIENYNPVSPADKLSCPYTDLLPHLQMARAHGHKFISLDGDMVKKANKTAFNYGRKSTKNMPNSLELEDSASVGFSLIDDELAEKAGIKNSDNVGIFITGMGLYASPSWVKEKIKIERRQEMFKNVKEAAGYLVLMAGFMTALLTLDSYVKNREEEVIYKQKVEMINQIIPYDKSMSEALEGKGKEHGINPNLIITHRTGIPGVVDGVISRYLELNRDKFSKTKNPEELILYNTLKRLIEPEHQQGLNVEK